MEIDFSQLEAFLVSKDKNDFIKKLIHNTDPYYYFSLIHAINNCGADLSKEQEESLRQYKDFRTHRSNSVWLRAMLLKLDKAQTDLERKRIMQEINQELFRFQFDHPQPIKITASKLAQKDAVLIHNLDKKQIDVKSLIEQGYKSYQDFQQIETKYYSHFDLKRLANCDLSIVREFLRNIDDTLACLDSVPELLVQYQHRERKENRMDHFQIPNHIFPKLNLTQLEAVQQKNSDFINNSDFVGELFMKKFQIDLKFRSQLLQSDEEKKERHKKLREMWEWTKCLPKKFESFSDQILFEMLQLGLDTNNYDFDLFITYLKNPKNIYSMANENSQKLWSTKNKQYQSNWHNFHNLDTGRWLSDDSLVRSYLEKFIMEKDDFKPFEEFVKTEFLKELYYKVKLYKGEAIENVTKLLGAEVLKQMNSEKLISICKFNKQYFEENQEVKLYVEIKNIQSLAIKVFELSTENYYLKNRKDLDPNISLDGLIASEEQIFTFNDAPVVKSLKEFKFEKITQKQRGIFIIEFIGGGISSRAIIKKGRLIFKEQYTLAGHVFQILDEKLQICKGEKTGIWLANRFHTANKETGQIIIPYTQISTTHDAVLVHNDFAQYCTITLLSENYEFKCAFIYSTQSFLMSNKAKILIQPRLFINDIPAPLDILKECKVTVNTMNEVDIPSTQTFDNLKPTHKEELEIEIPIPAKLRDIRIDVQAKIQQMIDDKTKTVNESHVISFNNYTNNSVFCSQFLRYTQDGGYEIYLLGKNGEPKSNVQLNLTFTLDGIRNKIQTSLHTDHLGKVHLGELENVVSIISSVQGVGDISANRQSWNIQQHFKINYPNHIRIVEGDKITLPYQQNDASIKSLNFVKVFKVGGSSGGSYTINNQRATVISNEINKLKQINNALVIEGLNKGYYKLKIYGDNESHIDIEVLKGKYWNNTTLIVTKNALIDMKRHMTNIVFDKVFISPNNENKDLQDINIKLYSDVPDQTRVHAIAMQFMPYDINQVPNDLQGISRDIPTKVIPNVKSTNSYLSNKTLGDEYRYVLERKKQERYVGNSLEKPQLLLKRTFIKDTTIRTEAISSGGGYQDRYQGPSDQNLMSEVIDEEETIRYNARRKNKPAQAVRYQREREEEDYEHTIERRVNKKSQGTISNTNEVNTLQNFLLHPAKIISNLKLDKDGTIMIQGLDWKNYSTVLLIATNLYNTVTKIVPLQKTEAFQTRDLTQKTNLKKGKYYSIYRDNKLLTKGEKFYCKDLTSTEIQLIDSIPKLFEVQKELRKCEGNDTENENGYLFWEFLSKWDEKMDLEEKHKKYDKYSCHELNIFLYCKDQAYFQDFVKPYISNKIEKTFVDYFLLNQEKQLNTYTSPEKIEQLNAMEIILLLIHLKESKQDEQAHDIYNLLEQKNKLKIYEKKTFKRLFDTILNSKTQSGDKSEIERLEHMARVNVSNLQSFSNMNQMPRQQIQQQQMVTQNYMSMNRMPQISNAMPRQMQIQQVQMINNVQLEMNNNYYGVQQNSMNNYDYDPFGSEQMIQQNFNPYQQQQFIEQRVGFIQQYQNLEKTKEYAEKQYYNQKDLSESKNLVQINIFWVELAKHIVTHGTGVPFLSQNFIYCNKNHTEMIGVLSFLALPFNNQNHKYSPVEGKGLEIEAGSSCIVFSKEIKETQSELKLDILIAQRFFDPSDRYIHSEDEPGVKYEKDVSEYIVNKKYGCQVIITNCSVTRHEFQVLVEVPEGSIPVNSIDYTKSHTMALESFTTKTIEYYFYFPGVGKFGIYPSNVSRMGNVVAVAQETIFNVLNEKTNTTLETMDEILSKGQKKDILEFIRTKNIHNPNILNFNDLLYLLKDKDFYLQVLDVLRKKKLFVPQVWSYSIYHGDRQSLKEFLNCQNIQQKIGNFFRYFQSDLFTSSSIRFLEYYPLQNSRVHMLHSDKSNILNNELRQQYQMFVEYCVEKGKLNIEDYLGLVYYLILQDRISEAIEIFQEIPKPKEDSVCLIQYDYFSSYLDLYIGYPNFKIARDLTEKYLDWPVITWRNLFYDIANRLAEFDGEEIVEENKEHHVKKEVKKKDIKEKNEQNAQKEEILNIELEGNVLHVTHQNVSFFEIKYYLIDLEVLFSSNPFLSQGKDDFSYVLANQEDKVEVNKEGGLQKTDVKIPTKFEKQNVFIQVSSLDKKQGVTYFSTSLKVQIIENYGQIKVMDKEDKPLQRVYVKAFAKENNSNNSYFYKDGYTDLVGRFDYASKSAGNLQNIQKFSIFVMSDELGSIIKETNPPSTVGKVDSKVELRGITWQDRALKANDQKRKMYEEHSTQVRQAKNAWNC